jgi:uncharacterized protein
MSLFDALLDGLPEGEVLDVRVGLHWTAVIANVGGMKRCGLASTLAGGGPHGTPDVPQAGRLGELAAHELAWLITADRLTLRSVGVATLNALTVPDEAALVDLNAGDVIADRGAGRNVALIGHFPFIPQVRARVGRLDVLELDPQPGEHPAHAAPDILPGADVVAITSMTLINGTLNGLLELCAPDALVLLLGPSTPLHPALFARGVDVLSGAVVTAIEPVVRAVSQGATFRQLHKLGVRLVNLDRARMIDR